MSDDLPTRLGKHVRARKDRDPMWEALAEGKLSAEEVREIEVAATEDAEIARLLELYRPLTHGAKRALVTRLARPTTISRKPSRTRTIAWVGIPVAIAAVVALLLLRPTELAPLPTYRVVAAGESELRGPTPDRPVVLHEGSTLDVVLQPADPSAEPVKAHAFVVQDGRIEPVAVVPDVANTGAVRFRAPRETIFGTRRGAVELVVIVGRPEGSPGNLVEIAKSGPDSGTHWRRLVIPVMLRDP